jgi:hypothetical protein
MDRSPYSDYFELQDIHMSVIDTGVLPDPAAMTSAARGDG